MRFHGDDPLDLRPRPRHWKPSKLRLGLGAFALGCLIFSNANPAGALLIFLSAVAGGLLTMEIVVPRIVNWVTAPPPQINAKITVDEDGNVFAMVDDEPALLDLPDGYHPSQDNGMMLAAAIIQAKANRLDQ